MNKAQDDKQNEYQRAGYIQKRILNDHTADNKTCCSKERYQSQK